ncbi:MAG: hypothetical protein K2G25_03895 [Oscillospiraceae bacterium]|nr:hypothetical protein [Oscillospiraceae bacterium]
MDSITYRIKFVNIFNFEMYYDPDRQLQGNFKNDPDYAYYEYVAIGNSKTCDLCASLTVERFRVC